METPENLARLIEKYQAGTATAEEIEILNQWYHSFDDSHARISEAASSEEELYESIKNRLEHSVTYGLKKRESNFRRRKLAIAAIITGGLLASSLYFYLSDKNDKPVAKNTATPQPVAPIVPGGDKAMLTLADGSNIILDSASNGLLALQGDIEIVKEKNGSLTYRMNGRTITEKDEAFYNTISTPRGGQYHIVLSDGTKVWLNAASSLRFPVIFTGNERRVAVTGETYFEVAKDAAKPFRVGLPAFGSARGQKTEIEVLGTHFNVNAYDDEAAIRTTLLEGKVKVISSQSTAFLSPGQQSVGKGAKISVLNNADTEEAVAWKNGRFQFNSTDLRTIFRQIARWYDVEVEYQGNVDLHFTGQLTRNEDVKKVFEKLELTGEVRFRTEGRKIIVTR